VNVILLPSRLLHVSLLENLLDLLLLVPRVVVEERIDLGEALVLELVGSEVRRRLGSLVGRDLVDDRSKLRAIVRSLG